MGSATENRYLAIYIDGKQAGGTLKELRSIRRKLNNEINAGTLSEKEYLKKVDDLKKVDGVLSKHNDRVKGVNRTWQRTKQIFAGVLGANLATSIFTKLFNFIPQLIGRNAKLSDSYADIAKNTGLSSDAVHKLDRSLKDIDTRTSRDKLREFAVEAGKAGESTEEGVKKFVEQANIINVALGDELGGAIRDVTKSSKIFKTDMLSIASAINTVGAESVASESYLVDFLARMGGTAEITKTSAPDILGYGATLDILGLKVEMSTTALNTFFIDFVKNSEKFGKAAGFAGGELTALIGEEGTNSGFLAFLQRLKESSTSSDDFLRKLEKLGIDGARGSQVFLALSNNIGLVKEQQLIANDAFTKGTSVIDEYNIKNNNLAANLERIAKWFGNYFANGALVRGISKVVNRFADWIKIPLSEKMEEERTQMRLLELKIIDVNTSSEDRIKLIKTLQKNYPDYLGNIDAEKISNQELQVELSKVNEALVNKIILQKKDEEVTKSINSVADSKINLLEEEDILRRKIVEAADKYNISLDENLSLMEQAKNISSQMPESNFFTKQFSDKFHLDTQIHHVAVAQKDLNEAEDEANSILKEKESLIKQLGITISEGKLDEGGNKNDGLDLLGLDPDAEEKLQKQLNDLNELMVKYRLDNALAGYTAREQELFELDAKYQKMRDMAKDNFEKLKEINVLHQEEMDVLQAQWLEEDTLKREELIEKLNVMRMSDNEREYYQELNKWTELLQEFEKYGIDTAALREAQNNALTQLLKEQSDRELRVSEKKNAQLLRQEHTLTRARIQAAQSVSDAMIYGIQAVAGEEARYGNYRKAIVIAQLVSDTVSAISSLIAASEANPNNAYTYGGAGAGQFAAGIIRILANVAMATQELSKSNTPAYATGSSLTDPRRTNAVINEYGPEMIQMPGGSKVFTAGSTVNILRNALAGNDRGLDASGLNGLDKEWGENVLANLAYNNAALDLVVNHLQLQSEMMTKPSTVEFVKDSFDAFNEKIGDAFNFTNF